MLGDLRLPSAKGAAEYSRYSLGLPVLAGPLVWAGEKPRPPRVPLVAVYPKDGTLFSDSPLFVLNAPWVSQKQQTAAHGFEAFVLQPENVEL